MTLQHTQESGSCLGNGDPAWELARKRWTGKGRRDSSNPEVGGSLNVICKAGWTGAEEGQGACVCVCVCVCVCERERERERERSPACINLVASQAGVPCQAGRERM